MSSSGNDNGNDDGHDDGEGPKGQIYHSTPPPGKHMGTAWATGVLLLQLL